jgi:nitrate reductase gamma subunit
MFATEIVAVGVRDGFPAFGWPDIWRQPGHPVRQAFALIYDISGLMILIGCCLAIVWRFTIRNASDRKYSDAPTTLFLLFVVATGFIVEGLRIAPTIVDPAHHWSFGGLATAQLLTAAGWTGVGAYAPIWLIHVLGSCAFIAYVPVMRLIHSCATPMGRLMNSQTQMLADKKRGVITGLMMRRPGLITPMNMDLKPDNQIASARSLGRLP